VPIDRLEGLLASELARLSAEGRRKGEEPVTVAVLPARGDSGPRVRLAGHGDRGFLRMNSNGYLGLARRAELVSAAERATREFGVGPAAVRFISGTHAPHVALESSLAAFHGREAAMVWSSAYAAVMGVLPPLVDASTAVISDELNHNCIINAIRLARPAERHVVPHLDLPALESALETAARG
jgi:glycine C-acetyltransferase